jgi:glutathione S-transferase
MIEIYHAPRTRGIRPIWACEELGLEYSVIPVDFSAEYRASESWRRMNPVGKVPVLVDGDLTMFESGAMVQYLIDRYGGGDRPSLQPQPGTTEHALYLQWGWFAESTFARPLGEIVNHQRAFAEEERSERAMEEMRERAWLCVSALEGALQSSQWILGETFRAADVMLGYSLKLHTELAPGPLPPAVARYWEALCARPGYQAAISA